MRDLKSPITICVAALVFLGLLSGCDRQPTVDGSDRSDVSPEVAAPPAVVQPALPADKQAPAVAVQPPVETRKTAASLDLTVKSAPLGNTAPAGSGRTTVPGWLKANGSTTDLETNSANGNVLPDLFDPQVREKKVTVDTELLLDDGERETSGIIDGAGMSIKYKTDQPR
mgnify:CR=1 FL=1